jgi:gamma-glutamyltranspeptidase/glutathione hydrolase
VLCAAALAALGTRALGQGQAPARAETRMVVAAHPLAAEAGIRILRAGGGAVDAAVAVQLVLSLVEPQSSGIGGGAFMLYFDGEADGHGIVTAYEGRETAPAAATAEMFLDPAGNELPYPVSNFGGLPVGVPGALRMLEMAHREHGRLAWADLFVPAIELAENGFEITPRLYFLLDQFANFARADVFRQHYYDASGRAHATGFKLVNPEYARTLHALAAGGAAALHSGPIAEAIVAIVADNPLSKGGMSLEDLRDYRAHEGEALCAAYRTWRICGPQLPSSGGITVLQTLGMLEPFDLASAGANTAASIHLVAEASRLAFADRNLYLADPAFVDVPVAGLLAPGYIAERARLVDPRATQRSVLPGKPLELAAWNYASAPFSELSSTSHFSIVDEWGDAVSMTTSVQSAFGSQLMVDGFILNNELTDFASVPERNGLPVANRPEAGKRPLSSMAPMLVFDDEGRLRLMVGSPGGTRIINYVVQTLVSALDWDMSVQEAVAAPHFLAQQALVELEEGTALIAETETLEALGHRVGARNLNSGLHGIAIEYTDAGRILWGGVDPRREGVALGD